MKRVDSVVSVKDSRELDDGKFLCSDRMREQRQQRQKQEFFPTAQCYITPRSTDDVTYELSKKRQEVWLSRLNRSDIKPESLTLTLEYVPTIL